MAVGAERKSATLINSESCASSFLVAAEGLEPQEAAPRLKANAGQFCAKPIQNNALDPTTVKFQKHNSTDPKHFQNTSLHLKCVPDVYQNDLAKVVSACG